MGEWVDGIETGGMGGMDEGHGPSHASHLRKAAAVDLSGYAKGLAASARCAIQMRSWSERMFTPSASAHLFS